jgi:hypothetical protein
MSFNYTNQEVARILATDYKSRNDDKRLMLRVWQEEGLGLTDRQREMFMSDKISSPETIRRTRQKLQEEGKFKAAKEVFNARRLLADQTKYTIVQETLL